jgi:AraC-like DNA-binding protein
MRPQSNMTARSFFQSELIRVGDVCVIPGTAGCTSQEVMDHHAIAIPLRGIFASHFSRRRVCVTTTNDAVLLGAGVPHHYSFPGGIGDHSLVLRWSAAAPGTVCPGAPEAAPFDPAQFHLQVTLPPRAIVERELLWRELANGNGDLLALEVRAFELLATILAAARRTAVGRAIRRRGSLERQRAQVERVKAAVAADPARRWTLSSLATLAAASPFHLARTFAARTAVSVHEYVLRMRLASALPWILDSDDGLTDIALRTGFSSHSHFTERFRTRFGVTPSELRRRTHRPVVRNLWPRTSPLAGE